MAKVLMMLDNAFRSDQRVAKTARSLSKAGFEVELWCTTDSSLSVFENRGELPIHRLIDPIALRPYRSGWRREQIRVAKLVAAYQPTVLICHDYAMLAIGYRAVLSGFEGKLVYDSHEFLRGWPFYRENRGWMKKLKGWLVWRRWLAEERRAFRFVQVLMTPSEGISKRMAAASFKGTTFTVRNVPERRSFSKPFVFDFIPDDAFVIVQIGSVYQTLTQMLGQLEAIVKLPKVHAVLIGNRPVHEQLKAEAAIRGWHRVHVVDYDETLLPSQLSACHAGLSHSASERYEAHRLSCSNKVMEYTAAGLPVIATEQETHRAMAQEYGHMVLFDNNSQGSFEGALKSLMSNFAQLHQKALEASTKLSWEEEYLSVANHLKSLIKQP